MPCFLCNRFSAMKKLWICSRCSMFSIHYTKLYEKAAQYALYLVNSYTYTAISQSFTRILYPRSKHATKSKATEFKIQSQSKIVSPCKLTLCVTSSIRINRRKNSIILHIFKAFLHEITEIQYGFFGGAAIFATHHFTTFAVFRLWNSYSSRFGYFVVNFYRCCWIFASCTLAIS